MCIPANCYKTPAGKNSLQRDVIIKLTAGEQTALKKKKNQTSRVNFSSLFIVFFLYKEFHKNIKKLLQTPLTP